MPKLKLKEKQHKERVEGAHQFEDLPVTHATIEKQPKKLLLNYKRALSDVRAVYGKRCTKAGENGMLKTTWKRPMERAVGNCKLRRNNGLAEKAEKERGKTQQEDVRLRPRWAPEVGASCEYGGRGRGRCAGKSGKAHNQHEARATKRPMASTRANREKMGRRHQTKSTEVWP